MSAQTKKASFMFGFLAALKRDRKMKSIDAKAALDFIELADGDRTFFRSARKLGEAIGCVESTAESSLARFKARGYLVLLDDPKASSGRNGGRLANTYRMEIPEVVSTEKSGKTSASVSPEKLGKTRKAKKEVSPEKSGRVSPENLGTITIEQTLEGARARVNAPDAITGAPITSVVLMEEGNDTDARQERAPEALEGPLGACPSDPDCASDIEPPETRPFAPVFESDIEVGAGDDGEEAIGADDDDHPATFEDLEAEDREERAAMAMAALRADLGISDLAFMDAVLGLANGSERDAAEALAAVRRVMLARPKSSRANAWRDIGDAVRGIVAGGGYRSDAQENVVDRLGEMVAADQQNRKAASAATEAIGGQAHA